MTYVLLYTGCDDNIEVTGSHLPMSLDGVYYKMSALCGEKPAYRRPEGDLFIYYSLLRQANSGYWVVHGSFCKEYAYNTAVLRAWAINTQSIGVTFGKWREYDNKHDTWYILSSLRMTCVTDNDGMYYNYGNTFRCNRLKCALVRLSSLLCCNMGHSAPEYTCMALLLS